MSSIHDPCQCEWVSSCTNEVSISRNNKLRLFFFFSFFCLSLGVEVGWSRGPIWGAWNLGRRRGSGNGSGSRSGLANAKAKARVKARAKARVGDTSTCLSVCLSRGRQRAAQRAALSGHAQFLHQAQVEDTKQASILTGAMLQN